MTRSTTIAPDQDTCGGEPGLPTVLARLRATAEAAGIVIFDELRAPWPDDNVGAYVSGRGFAAFNPCLDDDGLRADLIAFVIALTYSMAPRYRGPGHVDTPAGYLLVTCERMPDPTAGPGRLARIMAEQCGRNTGSATFRIICPAANAADRPCCPASACAPRRPGFRPVGVGSGRRTRCRGTGGCRPRRGT